MDKESIIAGIIASLIVFIFLSIGSIKNANGYAERPGSWTASEKRQIIDLLEQIEKNTR